LNQNHINYEWLGYLLGGFRNGGYEFHITTELFATGINKLIEIAKQYYTAIMCAEKHYLYCHRKFIADELSHRNWHVIHIEDTFLNYPHPMPLL